MSIFKVPEILKKGSIPQILFVGLYVLALALVIISVLVLDLKVVPVFVITVLEIVLEALLRRTRLWVHCLVVIAEVAAGIIFHQVGFMILMVALYVVALFVSVVREDV